MATIQEIISPADKTRLNDNFESINTQLEEHIAGTNDKHDAEDINFSSTRPTIPDSNVKDAIETVDERVDNILNNPDPNKDAELVDIRTSSTYGTFPTAGGRVDNTDNVLSTTNTELVDFRTSQTYGAFLTAKERGDNTDEILNLEGVKRLSDAYFEYPKSIISRAFREDGSGTLTLLGDSITVGVGSTNNEENGYASIVRDVFHNKQLDEGYGYDIYSDMNRYNQDHVDVTYSGSTSIGTKGASKQSLIMQIGSSITISNRDEVTFVDFIGTISPSSGKLQVYRGATLQKTIDFVNGTTVDNHITFPTAQIAQGSDDIIITCIDAPVEIYGVYTLKPSSAAMTNARIATSGYATSDYVGNTAAITAIGNFFSTRGVYVLAIGTNDIYSATKAISASAFKTNLQTLITDIRASNASNSVILCVPPISNETIFPPIIEPHENYKTAVYELSETNSLPVMDFSDIDFVSRGLYADGVHPTDAGHVSLARFVAEKLGYNIFTTFPQRVVKTAEIPATAFSTNGANQVYTFPFSSDWVLLSVSIKNETNELTVPYHEYTDYNNNIGLAVLTKFAGTGDDILMYYNTANGFCNIAGPLSPLLTNTPADATFVIKYMVQYFI